MFSKLFNRLSHSVGNTPFALSASARFFGKALGKGLGSKIGEYIAEGLASSVLAELSRQPNRQKWQQRQRTWPRRDDDKLFTSIKLWRTDQLRRFGEVLEELEPITYDWGFFGSKASPGWLRHVVTMWIGEREAKTSIDALIALAADNDLGPEAALDIVFSRDASHYGRSNTTERFKGYDNWLRGDADALIAAAALCTANVRIELAATVGRLRLHDLYMPLLLDLATGTAKGPRKAANQALTGASADVLKQSLGTAYASGSPAKRALLVETIANAMGADAAPYIAQLREGEDSAKVLGAMDRFAGAVATPRATAARNPWQQDGAEGYTAIDGTWITAPPRPELPKKSAIPQDAANLLIPVVEAHNEKMLAEQKRYAHMRYHWARDFKATSPSSAIGKLRSQVEGSFPVSAQYGTYNWLNGHLVRHGNIDRFFDHPGVTLRHLVRIAIALNGNNFAYLFGNYTGVAGRAIQRRIEAGADIRTVFALWRSNGGEDFIDDYLGRGWYSTDIDWGEKAWPLFLEKIDQIDSALGLIPQHSQQHYNVQRALGLLALFPKVPERYRARLMILANESATRLREAARDLLADAPDISDAIALQLEDGKQDIRAQAADWLVRRGAKEHIPTLRTRLKKERSDKARAAMITALERLGDDTSDFFDQTAMIAEARQSLAKVPPKGLDWFPLDALPALRWADGTPVDPVLPRHWVMLATRLKEPGGNALIDLWLDRLADGDAHRLGWMILTGWIAEDTRTPSDEEANAHALAHVDAVLKSNRDYAKRWPQSADYFSTDYETVFAQLKRGKANTYLSSAADSKGMLALASRVEGSDAAPRIRAFLKDHGSRTSQAKALLDVLASIGTPAALQVLLSTADRLKQKSVQAHATKLIEDIADQRGWTAAELADRTVPTGGLDEAGVLELDCGPNRLYTARLDEEDRLALYNAAGKEVKALPAARMEDEAAQVAAAKKALSKARKEVKQVVTAQTERFREAMCLERSWPAEDWVNYVVGHPILSRLAARLVWLGLDDKDTIIASLRPLGDGTFSDAEDSDIDPAQFTAIKLAHSTLLDAKAGDAWRAHLADYAVTPLFDQLGRALPEITDAMRKQHAITDREGWMIESFALRGIATKLGYHRGETVDGGCFMTYIRTLREAGLVAEIEFTGSYLPEQNIPAALVTLSFRKLLGNGKTGGVVDLSEVPDVLLAETWRDLYDIADKGSGFDADWQQKAAL